MTAEERERMNSICIRIQEEQDYGSFATLLRELSELIARKEQRRFRDHPKLIWQRNRPSKSVPAVVKRIVKSTFGQEPEKVEISIPAADDLFREIRIENNFIDVDGATVTLTNGAQVEVTFEAETKDTVSGTTKTEA